VLLAAVVLSPAAIGRLFGGLDIAELNRRVRNLRVR
jgi:hypothetical protein